MKFRIAVCDDEDMQIRYLTALIRAWAEKRGYIADVRSFSSAESFLFAYSEEKDFDLLLLDIEMEEGSAPDAERVSAGEGRGRMNGVELARRVRGENDRVQIVFITGFPDYMSEGYEVAALHYLMKPVSADKLEEVLDRAVKNLGKAEGRLAVRFARQTEYIPFSRIIYIEAQLQYVIIHTAEEDHRMKASLSEVEKELDEGFFRCQRSFIINLSQVQKIKSDCVLLKNGVSVPIGRGMGERIGKAIIQHF